MKNEPTILPGEINDPFISVLIVNYNGINLLKECLDSLKSQSFQNFEVVLVDNASIDGSVDFIRNQYSWVQVIKSEKNLGFGGGNNFGFPYCKGKFIYFLNTDIKADSSALQGLADAVQKFPTVNIFASLLIRYHDHSKVDSAGDTIYTCGKSFTWSGYPVEMFQNTRFITSACAGAALYSRSVLEKIGLFDADFFLNFEDLDLSFRAQHFGEKILFVPDSRIYHYGSVSQGGKTSPTSLYYAERNYGLFILKNFPTRILLEFIPSFIFVKIWGFFKACYSRCPMAYFRGNIAFFSLLSDIPAKRKAILNHSKLSTLEFRNLLRKNWLKEKIAFLKGDFKIPTDSLFKIPD